MFIVDNECKRCLSYNTIINIILASLGSGFSYSKCGKAPTSLQRCTLSDLHEDWTILALPLSAEPAQIDPEDEEHKEGRL